MFKAKHKEHNWGKWQIVPRTTRNLMYYNADNSPHYEDFIVDYQQRTCIDCGLTTEIGISAFSTINYACIKGSK